MGTSWGIYIYINQKDSEKGMNMFNIIQLITRLWNWMRGFLSFSGLAILVARM